MKLRFIVPFNRRVLAIFFLLNSVASAEEFLLLSVNMNAFFWTKVPFSNVFNWYFSLGSEAAEGRAGVDRLKFEAEFLAHFSWFWWG